MSKASATSTWTRAGLLLGVSLGALVVTTPALAQDNPSTTSDDAEVVEPDQSVAVPDTEQPQAEGDIVITGSRIRRTEATSESPLQIIDPVLSQRQGKLSTAEIVQNSPITSGSTQVTAALSSNTIANGGLGVQTVSLRGLGANRTLVLLNSRRAGPAGTRGAVSAFDLNVLPSSIMQSVEVLKDGASSIYGSDAIAGVVNLITKRDTDGLEFNGFSSVPMKGGGEEYNVSVAWGKDFGRGHFLIAGDLYRRNELERSDRDFLGCPQQNLVRPDGSRADLIDPRTGEYTCNGGTLWGHVWAYYSPNLPSFVGVDLLQYSYPGDNLGNFIPPVVAANQGDLSTPAGWYPVRYNCPLVNPTPTCLTQARNASALSNAYHPFEQKSTVLPETDRHSLFATASFEITPSIEVYGEGLFNRRRTYIDSYTQIYNFGVPGLFSDTDPENPFPGFGLPFGYYLANPNEDPADPGDDFLYPYISPTGIIDDYDNELIVKYYRGVAGVRGDIGSNWRWDVYGQYSKSDGKYRFQQIRRDAISQQTNRGFGAPCAGTRTRFTMIPCQQINWVDPYFLRGELTQAQTDYFVDWEEGNTKYIQKYVEASIAGEPFALPAGDVGIAVGATVRRDSIDDLPGYLTYFKNPFYDASITPGSTACRATSTARNNRICEEYFDNVFANPFSSGHTQGYAVTKEAFGEIRVPILRDSPIAKELTFAAAARITSVKATREPDGATDSDKGNWTYKLQGNWQVNDWLRLRSTYGTSFRAPALFEQVLASQSSGARQGAIDPCVQWGVGLANGSISQRVADNCAADGIPSTHTGAGIQATVLTSGGLGRLDPETSKSFTASLILTPRFSFLPDTDLALTIDYFDIRVNGEIARLTAADIVGGCYASDNFPNEPLCNLFERGQDGNSDNIRNVFAQYINIDKQRNRGLDFTLRVRQNLGSLGRLSILAQATRQLEDIQTRLGQDDDFNGDIGDPKFTADLNTTWDIGDTSVFWGMNVVGKSSSEEDFIELNGTLCNITPNGQQIYGDYCVLATTPTMFYHNASITQRVTDKYEFTFGISNLFDTKPPISSGVTTLGNVPLFATQYDWLGRRFFVQAKARF